MTEIVSVLEQKSILCKWEESCKCYSWTEPRLLLTGITKRLKKRFYPKSPKHAQIKGFPARFPGYKKGLEVGKEIHKQLESTINGSKKSASFLDPRVCTIINAAQGLGWKIIRSVSKHWGNIVFVYFSLVI